MSRIPYSFNLRLCHFCVSLSLPHLPGSHPSFVLFSFLSFIFNALGSSFCSHTLFVLIPARLKVFRLCLHRFVLVFIVHKSTLVLYMLRSRLFSHSLQYFFPSFPCPPFHTTMLLYLSDFVSSLVSRIPYSSNLCHFWIPTSLPRLPSSLRS